MTTTSDTAPTGPRRALNAVIGLAAATVGVVTRPIMLFVGRALAPGHLRQASYIRPTTKATTGPR